MSLVNVGMLELDVIARLKGLDHRAYLCAMAIILRDSQNLHAAENTSAAVALVGEAISAINCKSGPACTIGDADIIRLLENIQSLVDNEIASAGLAAERETAFGVLSELVGQGPEFYGAETVTSIPYQTLMPAALNEIIIEDADEQLEEDHPVIAKLRQYLEVVSQIEATSPKNCTHDFERIYSTVFQSSN
jgi:hypothetical protein